MDFGFNVSSSGRGRDRSGATFYRLGRMREVVRTGPTDLHPPQSMQAKPFGESPVSGFWRNDAMITSAVNALLLALLTLLPTATRSTGPDDSDGSGANVIFLGNDDVEFENGEPVVVRVGRRGFIGVTLLEITPELRAHFGAPKDAGVLVSDVESGTPAAKAGLEVGDVITEIDGKRVESSRDLSRGIRSRKAGETVQLDVVRARASRKMSVTVEEREARQRTIDLGDLGDMKDKLRRHAWVMRDFGSGDHPVIENLEDLPRMSDRLEELEKRVKELEKRLPGR
jgi:PDZ domain-containing protein